MAGQFDSPRNLEAFYPFPLPTITPGNNRSLPRTPGSLPSAPRSSSKKAVGTAIGITLASTLLFSAIFFFLVHKYLRRKNRASQGGAVVVPPNEFDRFNGNLKGVIVDENGLDVLYWRRLENQEGKSNFKKQIVKYVRNEDKEEEKRVMKRSDEGRKEGEVPLFKGESSTSEIQTPIRTQMEQSIPPSMTDLKAVGKQPSADLPAPPLPPPIPPKKAPGPPPPPPPMKAPGPPPPPPMKAPGPPPPPPPKGGGLASSSKPPPVPKGMQSLAAETGQVKLKPLHWDKVNANVNHSMVWNKIEGGSFKVDDDLMESLFGYVATGKKSPLDDTSSSIPTQSTKIYILDNRKSQNTAIVLRSLTVSRSEIIDAFTDGHGLDMDTLEKLHRIAPTIEEQAEILAYNDDPTRLADAESFLFHLLKAVPSAFMRCNAMFFRSHYDSEVSPFKESLQILEAACNELRTKGIFLKLLEAILKAGNRMNAGTSRGNAQAFNLTSLGKLSDVKSTDGKTTLLHFVVEEVVRAEGKRVVLNRNVKIPDKSVSRDEREKEYIMLGLPLVSGLSAEFFNVKRSATIDYDTLAKTCSDLAARVTEIKKLVEQCGNDGGGFVTEMKSFLDGVEKEIKIMSEEQTRIMELVKKTTDYYQAGASKDKNLNNLQLFGIIRDFLIMVDQACIVIGKNWQKKKPAKVGVESSKPKSLENRAGKFPLLPRHFLSDKSNSSDSDNDDDFPS